ncbi:RNA cap guanine-N2 methyltransferase [Opisthorchis viverrini]|uniref:Trimethylguanosine synthase n=1 Tax=Opisthorchis viverrini TaxID=6198 RepID=A0A1S8WXC0_OPIVI|nr:RNA cap guanine-N2 methyltransferase [Opisthorchis viverrini]
MHQQSIKQVSSLRATPEVIAAHQARRVYRALVNDPSAVHRFTVIDACSGAGVNSIQLALLGFHVIAIEIDPARIAMSVHNAQIYGVQSRIEFVCADFFTWARDQLSERNKTHGTLPYGAVILSPPWGGPTYLDQSVFDLDSIRFGSSPSYDFWLATDLASQLSLGNLVIFLPRNTNVAQLSALSAPIRSARLRSSGRHLTAQCPDEIELEIEVNLINSKIKALTVYSGDLCTGRKRRSTHVSDRPNWSPGEVAFGHDENDNGHFYVDSDLSSSCSSSSGSYLSASENF